MGSPAAIQVTRPQVAAMAWFTVFARGPLEHLVHVVSMRATQADGH